MVRHSVPQQDSPSAAAPGKRQASSAMRTPALLHCLAATFVLAGAAACSAAPSGVTVTSSPSPWSAKCIATPRGEASPPRSDLTIVAEMGAAGCGFDTTRLAALAGRAVTIEYLDRDTTLPHNFAIYRRPERDLEGLVAATAYLLAPQRETLSLPALEAGTYYFYCDTHTRTMFGTLTAVDGTP